MKRINWLDHLANLLVVILGISIAFYLEGYRAEQDNRRQEVVYLESLISDLETDVQTLDTLIKLNKGISSALISLNNASIGLDYSKDTTIAERVRWIQYNPPFTPQITTYESLKESGKIELVGDFQLRNEVIELYEQYYRGAKQYDAALTEHVRDYIKPFFVKRMTYVSRDEIDLNFLTMNEFKNIIFYYRYLFIQKNDYYEETIIQVSNLIEQLGARVAALKA